MIKVKSYKEYLLDQLQNPEEATSYFNAALCSDPDVFLLALDDITEAQKTNRPH